MQKMKLMMFTIIFLLVGVNLQAEESITNEEIRDVFTSLTIAMNKPSKDQRFSIAVDEAVTEARNVIMDKESMKKILDNELIRATNGLDLSEEGLIYRKVSGSGWYGTIIASPVMIYPMAVYLNFTDYPLGLDGYQKITGTYKTVVPNSSIVKTSSDFLIQGDGLIKSFKIDIKNGESTLFKINNTDMESSILVND